jgi:uncharacterized membrane protein
MPSFRLVGCSVFASISLSATAVYSNCLPCYLLVDVYRLSVVVSWFLRYFSGLLAVVCLFSRFALIFEHHFFENSKKKSIRSFNYFVSVGF